MSMKVVVVSHKPCWRSPRSLSGFATDGGFAFHMEALSGIVDELRVLVPVSGSGPAAGEVHFAKGRISIVPLGPLKGSGIAYRVRFMGWVLLNFPRILVEILRADGVHTPIPGDVGTIGMLLAWVLRKPLYVRHCGNWLKPCTTAEKFWRWFMESVAGGRNVMLATGGSDLPPSSRTPHVHWIFSSSLTESELRSVGRVRSLPAAGPIRVAIVARQEPAKGGGRLIEALALLPESMKRVQVEIVGDGSAIRSYKELSSRLGVSDRVHFTGKLNHEEVLHCLNESHLFAFPTTSSDGFPKAVLEAMATGLPVVATGVSVLPQLLGHGGGILIPSASPADVAAGITNAISDPDQYGRMSKSALATAMGFSLENWAREIRTHLKAGWAGLV